VLRPLRRVVAAKFGVVMQRALGRPESRFNCCL
jgi:hypothetical protein